MSYGYEFQINYDDTKKPIFRSDRYQFTVVMPNLNYNVPEKEVLIDPEKMLIHSKKALIDLKNTV